MVKFRIPKKAEPGSPVHFFKYHRELSIICDVTKYGIKSNTLLSNRIIPLKNESQEIFRA